MKNVSSLINYAKGTDMFTIYCFFSRSNTGEPGGKMGPLSIPKNIGKETINGIVCDVWENHEFLDDQTNY